MTPMPEIVIEDTLNTMLAYVRVDQRYLQDFFGEQPQAIQNDIFRFFRNEAINIGAAFQEDERSAPTISILAGDGGSADEYVGDYLGTELDDDNFTSLLLIGERQRGSVKIVIDTINNRQTSYLAAFVKAALMMNKPIFSDIYRLNEMTMDWQELEIDQSSTTRPIFKYTITVSFVYNIVVAQRYGPTPEKIGEIGINPVVPPSGVSEDDDLLYTGRLLDR